MPLGLIAQLCTLENHTRPWDSLEKYHKIASTVSYDISISISRFAYIWLNYPEKFVLIKSPSRLSNYLKSNIIFFEIDMDSSKWKFLVFNQLKIRFVKSG